MLNYWRRLTLNRLPADIKRSIQFKKKDYEH